MLVAGGGLSLSLSVSPSVMFMFRLPFGHAAFVAVAVVSVISIKFVPTLNRTLNRITRRVQQQFHSPAVERETDGR